MFRRILYVKAMHDDCSGTAAELAHIYSVGFCFTGEFLFALGKLLLKTIAGNRTKCYTEYQNKNNKESGGFYALSE